MESVSSGPVVCLVAGKCFYSAQNGPKTATNNSDRTYPAFLPDSSLPTLEGKKQVYAVSESPNGLLVNLNIRGTHSWTSTAFPKSREAYKKILGHIPAGYQQWFKTAQLALESDMPRQGNSLNIRLTFLWAKQHFDRNSRARECATRTAPRDQKKSLASMPHHTTSGFSSRWLLESHGRTVELSA